ncbi:MAG: 1-(5-phosphoribosyl)-5-[(5-phosphoribosylamino)methylideneamino] imidazole-4-carboxamide isomerase, partial [Verrucomicrobia bacterium]|nr:1-(5-phosphoribosyl)-5-[(5-phosphoribosylamino)methylideneamino] imidazole-4-carboxamide isomerase [Verrucomicrobiota bacterium]
MFVIPSIDLMAGEVVRLAQGKATEKKVYSNDPMACARRWEKAGGKVLHLVDLEGAFEGQMRNLEMIGQIARTVKMPCQVGGGIRDLEVAEKIIKAGAQRVIFGSVACDTPEIIDEAVKRFGPERVVVGIDARDGVVETRGWTKPSGWKALDLASRMNKAGVIRIIYTDVVRDGMMTGPNIPAVQEMVKSFPGKVISSGGISGRN